LGQLRTADKRMFQGPVINNWDMEQLKATHLTESKFSSFGSSFFNVSNHTLFTADRTSANSSILSSTFRYVTRARDRPGRGQTGVLSHCAGCLDACPAHNVLSTVIKAVTLITCEGRLVLFDAHSVTHLESKRPARTASSGLPRYRSPFPVWRLSCARKRAESGPPWLGDSLQSNRAGQRLVVTAPALEEFVKRYGRGEGRTPH
jgi:hypothetical protein